MEETVRNLRTVVATRRGRLLSSGLALVLAVGLGVFVAVGGSGERTRWLPFRAGSMQWPGGSSLHWPFSSSQQPPKPGPHHPSPSISPLVALATTPAPTEPATPTAHPPTAPPQIPTPRPPTPIVLPPTPPPPPDPTPTPTPTPTATPTPTPTPSHSPTPSSTPSTLLFKDDFERDTGSTVQGWTVAMGTWTAMTDGTRVARGTSTDHALISVGDPAWTDYSMTAQVKASSSSAGFVVVRYQDAGNFYGCGLDTNNMAWLGKMYGGTWYDFGYADFDHSANRFYNVTLTVKGNDLTCLVSDPVAGVNKTMTASVPYFVRGGIGLVAEQSAEFDNVVVNRV